MTKIYGYVKLEVKPPPTLHIHLIFLPFIFNLSTVMSRPPLYDVGRRSLLSPVSLIPRDGGQIKYGDHHSI